MALGVLARSGPSHGHHIRRVADVTNVGEWGGVSVGALYRELRAMEREGLVEAARTEKVGNRPERTVYAITAEGQLELTTLREQAIRPLGSGPDPLGVALLFAADGMDPEELRRTLRARREMLAIGVREIAADREQLHRQGVPRRARGVRHAAGDPGASRRRSRGTTSSTRRSAASARRRCPGGPWRGEGHGARRGLLRGRAAAIRRTGLRCRGRGTRGGGGPDPDGSAPTGRRQFAIVLE